MAFVPLLIGVTIKTWTVQVELLRSKFGGNFYLRLDRIPTSAYRVVSQIVGCAVVFINANHEVRLLFHLIRVLVSLLDDIKEVLTEN